MNTQNLLYSNSDKISEGLYIELMNNLKIDFDNNEKKIFFVITKCLPSTIAISKREMIQNIIKESQDWVDREELLVKITGRIPYFEIKRICLERKLPVMKTNPRWVREVNQLEEIQQVEEPTTQFLNVSRHSTLGNLAIGGRRR
jgi:hypothetical protein